MTEEKAKRISELKQSDLKNIDCMEIVLRTDCNKHDLIKVQDIINQNEQLKSDKEELVKLLNTIIYEDNGFYYIGLEGDSKIEISEKIIKLLEHGK